VSRVTHSFWSVRPDSYYISLVTCPVDFNSICEGIRPEETNILHLFVLFRINTDACLFTRCHCSNVCTSILCFGSWIWTASVANLKMQLFFIYVYSETIARTNCPLKLLTIFVATVNPLVLPYGFYKKPNNFLSIFFIILNGLLASKSQLVACTSRFKP
jgi:hypothetical protein